MAGLFITDTNANGANICSGDSGGAMPVSGESGPEPVAVNSKGKARLMGRPVVTASARTDGVASWVAEQVTATHCSGDVCDVNGWYEDGTCHRHGASVDPDCPTGTAGAGGDATNSSGGGGGATPAPTLGDAASEGGGGCIASGRGAQIPWAWFMTLLGLVALRRRR